MVFWVVANGDIPKLERIKSADGDNTRICEELVCTFHGLDNIVGKIKKELDTE